LSVKALTYYLSTNIGKTAQQSLSTGQSSGLVSRPGHSSRRSNGTV
jgi:hypothetical protein